MPAIPTPPIFVARAWRSALLALVVLMSVVAWPFVFEGFNPVVRNAFISIGDLGPAGLLIFIVLVTAIAAVPPVAGPAYKLLNLICDKTSRRRGVCSIVAALGSTAYLSFTAVAQHRQFFPYYHDEFSYLIQARQFAQGHLWMPAHPLAAYFDSFQLLVHPVYASAYFPGTAMVFVPGIWLHLPPYITSLVVAGAVAGFMFWITAELLDGLWAWVAVLLLLSNSLYRELSIMTLAQLPLLLFVLSAVIAWLRWRVNGKTIHAICIGVFLGLAAITRPVDAAAFAIPIGIAVVASIVIPTTGPRVMRDQTAAPRRPSAVLAIVVGLLPSLVLELVLNHGITGRWLHTPFTLYADRDYPGTAYGFHPFDPNAMPVSELPQKRMLYERCVPMNREHRPSNILSDLYRRRLRLTLAQQSPVPYPLLVLFCPLALLKMSRSRAVLFATLPVYLLLSAPYVFFLPHYVIAAMPGLTLAILAGGQFVIAYCTTRGSQRLAMVAVTLFVAGQAVAALPQFTGDLDDGFSARLLMDVNRQLAMLPRRPSVVLFTFDPKRNLDEEPVYNADVAWPDDAEVIRAHDLGPRNTEIFRYYAERQPGRFFYRFDEATGKLQPLGMAEALVAQAPDIHPGLR